MHEIVPQIVKMMTDRNRSWKRFYKYCMDLPRLLGVYPTPKTFSHRRVVALHWRNVYIQGISFTPTTQTAWNMITDRKNYHRSDSIIKTNNSCSPCCSRLLGNNWVPSNSRMSEAASLSRASLVYFLILCVQNVVFNTFIPVRYTNWAPDTA